MRRALLVPMFLVGAALAAGLASGMPAAAEVASPRAEVPPAHPRATASLAARHLPCDFEANRGQTAAEVDYVARCSGYTAFLTGGDAVIRTRAEAFRIHVAGGRDAAPVASRARPGKTNYLLGGARDGWITQVPHAGRVEYRGVLPGVDVAYRTQGRSMAFDLLLGAGVDPSTVRLELDGTTWAGPDAEGNLAMGLPSGGTATFSAPRAWQGEGAGRRDVTVAFARGASRDEVGFEVGDHDPSKPLVIDPSLTVSTYLGGSSDEFAQAIRTDSDGAIHLVGYSKSLDFPTTTGAFQETKGDSTTARRDTFVAKFDARGRDVEFVTYLGGSQDDTGTSLAVDASGGIYVVGNTSSTNFPLKNAYQSAPANGFLTKLDASGSALAWSTYYQYPADFVGLDAAGDVHAFSTSSKRVYAFDGNGTTLRYSVSSFAYDPPQVTFTSFAVDPTGAVWLGGSIRTGSGSSSLGMGGPFQQSHAGGSEDGWLVKINTTGSEVYRSYLGGSGSDHIRDLALGPSGNLLVTGFTSSDNFPRKDAAQDSRSGFEEGFVTMLNPAANALVFSTFLGGSSGDYPMAVASAPSGGMFVAGYTFSTDFPAKDAFQATYGGGDADCFLAEYLSDGTLERSTYVGGSANDNVEGLAVSSTGRPLMVGTTSSADFPVACAHQPSRAGGDDTYLAGVADSAAMTPDESPYDLPGATVGRPYSTQLAIAGGDAPFTWALDSGTLPDGLSLSQDGLLEGTPTAAASPSLFVEIFDGGGACTIREFRIVVSPVPAVPASDLAPWTVGRAYAGVLPVTGGTAPFTWTLASGTPPAATSVTSGGTLAGTPTAAGTTSFGVSVLDANGATATGTVSVTIHPHPAFAATVLPPWTVDRLYDQKLDVVDGTPPFTWSKISGTLPVGTPLAPATGMLHGFTVAPGDYAFRARVTDASGAFTDGDFTMHVNPLPSITTTALPLAAAGRPYAAPVVFTGGTAPFAWSLVSGGFGPGFTGLDAASGVVLGTPGDAGNAAAAVRVVDAAGAADIADVTLTVVSELGLAKGRTSRGFVVSPGNSGEDIVRYVELLAGSKLDITATLSHANLFAVDLLLLDSAEQPLDLRRWKKKRDPVVSVRGFPVPATGRYLVVVRQPEGFTGNVKLAVAARAATTARGSGTVDPAGDPVLVSFAALPGSKLTLTTAAKGGSHAVPRIVSLKDAAGNELLVASDVKNSKRGATLRTKAKLAGGDYVATIAAPGGEPGSVTWSVSLDAPGGYRFTLPGLPVTGE